MCLGEYYAMGEVDDARQPGVPRMGEQVHGEWCADDFKPLLAGLMGNLCQWRLRKHFVNVTVGRGKVDKDHNIEAAA